MEQEYLYSRESKKWVVLLEVKKGKCTQLRRMYVSATTTQGAIKTAKENCRDKGANKAFATARIATAKDLGCVPLPIKKDQQQKSS